jgi:hypothetical protein
MNFDKISGAAESAYARIDKVTKSKPPDLAIYDQLTPEALKSLEELYGTDQVTYYIQEMEAKRRVKYGETR